MCGFGGTKLLRNIYWFTENIYENMYNIFMGKSLKFQQSMMKVCPATDKIVRRAHHSPLWCAHRILFLSGKMPLPKICRF